VLGLELHALFRGIERLDKVVIAAINDRALSIGCELALAAIRYMADDARAIRLLEMTLGVMPGAGDAAARADGRAARALELILRGAAVTPGEALAAGLVHRVFPHDRLVAGRWRRGIDSPAERRVGRGRQAAVWEGASARSARASPRAEVVHGGAVAARGAPGAAATSTRCARRAGRRGRDAATREAWSEGTAVDLLAEED
jgi:enoyl-CoA hydratase/carnithine racemase